MNQQVDETERDEIFARLKTDQNNNKCFDCDKKNPKWSSVYLGIYLCLDCAGKHREYGPQISFARSLNLDSWNRRYITFMELGGNTKALEAFKKVGLKTPYDYKNPAIQKYKQELTKKVDAALGSNTASQDTNKPIFASKPAEEEKTKTEPVTTTGANFSSPKVEKTEDDPFANNIVLNKAEVKTKGFSVEFNKNKPAFGSGNKTRLAAKKVDNFDLDALTLNEDGAETKTKTFDMMGDTGMTDKSAQNTTPVKEVFAKSSTPYTSTTENDQDTFKKFSNAKAISSDSFRTDKGQESGNYRQFSGASSISSSQYYGEKEEPASQGIDYYQAGENIRDFVSTWGSKIKAKTETVVNKLKSDWQQ